MNEQSPTTNIATIITIFYGVALGGLYSDKLFSYEVVHQVLALGGVATISFSKVGHRLCFIRDPPKWTTGMDSPPASPTAGMVAAVINDGRTAPPPPSRLPWLLLQRHRSHRLSPSPRPHGRWCPQRHGSHRWHRSWLRPWPRSRPPPMSPPTPPTCCCRCQRHRSHRPRPSPRPH